MNWLVTGGCGFIGRKLIDRLLQSGTSVRILDNLSTCTPDDMSVPVHELPSGKSSWDWTGKGVDLVVADIRDADATAAAIHGAEVVVHLAASTGVEISVENPRMDCEVNVLGTLNCLEAARLAKARRFVFASSGAPMGGREPPLHEELAPRPLSPYGASKASGEAYCLAYHGCYGLETVGLRFGNVYGPGSAHKQSVVAKFLRKSLAGESLEIYGDGNQTRDFVFIDDLIDAIERAATTPGIGGELFQIATQKESTVGEVATLIVELVKAQTGQDIPVIHGSERLGDAERNFSDVTKAREVLGYVPRTSLREGIEKTLKYFVSN